MNKALRNLIALAIVMLGLSQVLIGQNFTFESTDPEMAKAFDRLLKARNDTAKNPLEVRVTGRAADGSMKSTKVIDNRRLVQKGEKFGYEDSLGTMAIPCTYDFANDFKKGKAVVGKHASDGKNYHKWHIDKNGKALYGTDLYRDVHDFVNGYAVVDVTGGYEMCHIKPDGKPLYTERYTYCYDFNTRGRAIVERVNQKKNLVTYMVIDISGKVLDFKQYKFSENRANPNAMDQVKKDLAQFL